MSEQNELLMQLGVARELIERPSRLTGRSLKEARVIAKKLGDRVYFNCGWHAAHPSGSLKGVANTKKIATDLDDLIKILGKHALKPKRLKAGRPIKEPEVDGRYLFVIADWVVHEGKRTLIDCVRDAVKTGLLDKTTKDITHVRRIERSMKKMPSSNVVPFTGGRTKKPK